MNLLIKRGIIHNTNHGYVDRNGNDIGFYRTKGVARKRYVKDKFVNMLNKLQESHCYSVTIFYCKNLLDERKISIYD